MVLSEVLGYTDLGVEWFADNIFKEALDRFKGKQFKNSMYTTSIDLGA